MAKKTLNNSFDSLVDDYVSTNYAYCKENQSKGTLDAIISHVQSHIVNVLVCSINEVQAYIKNNQINFKDTINSSINKGNMNSEEVSFDYFDLGS